MKMQFFITLSFILIWSIKTVAAAGGATYLPSPSYAPAPSPYMTPSYQQKPYFSSPYDTPSRSAPEKPQAKNPPSQEVDVKFSDEIEIQQTINSGDIDNMLALAYVYRDMNNNSNALELFKAANRAALDQDTRLDSRARTYWGELILGTTTSRQAVEEAVTLIVDAAIEDDDPNAIGFLLRQSKDFEKYIGNNASDGGSEEAKNILLSMITKSSS